MNKIIAVLIRAPYPADLTELRGLVESASSRIALLESISHRFEQSSILAAQNSLSQLSSRISKYQNIEPIEIT